MEGWTDGPRTTGNGIGRALAELKREKSKNDKNMKDLVFGL